MLLFLGEAGLRTLILAAVVQLGLGLLRIERPQLRLLAWTVVLAASLSMPALQWATPLRLSVLPDVAGAALVDAANPRRQAPVSQASTPAPIDGATAPIDVMPWLEASYLLIAAVLGLRLAVGIVLSLRVLRKAAPVQADWAAATRVRISRDIAAPVTIANVVLLPGDVVTWPAAMRRAVMAHERAHVARWDFAMLLASQINRAVFWFSPLSWWLHRRLAALAELASDDQALEVIGDRPAYAEVLLEMGRRSGPLLRGLAMARPATLSGRIERVLSHRASTGPVSPARQMLLAISAAGLTIVAAGSRPNAVPLDPVLPAEQRPFPTALGVTPPPPAPMAEERAEPRAAGALLTDIAAQAPPPPVSVAQAATPSLFPGLRAAAQSTVRPTTRTLAIPPPSRATVPPLRAVRDQGGQHALFKAGALLAASPASRGNDGHGTASSLGGTAGVDGPPTSPRTGQPYAGETPLAKRPEEPSCTGVYLPRPEGVHPDGSVDFVQAKYFQEADGTPWLKLFIGARTRATLSGFQVERISVRTTVVTTLPKGMAHVTGTTHGTYGTIDFECGSPSASL